MEIIQISTSLGRGFVVVVHARDSSPKYENQYLLIFMPFQTGITFFHLWCSKKIKTEDILLHEECMKEILETPLKFLVCSSHAASENLEYCALALFEFDSFRSLNACKEKSSENILQNCSFCVSQKKHGPTVF